MFSYSVKSALAAAVLFRLVGAQDIPTPSAEPSVLNAMTAQGCYSDSFPLTDHGEYTYQSSGNCQKICVLLKKPVMGLVNGSNCLCGDLLPASDKKVSDDECDTPCQGFDQETCGGNNRWQVSLTGLNKNKIPHLGDPGVSVTKSGEQVVTIGGSTVVMTVPPTNDGSSGGGGGPNKAGIAAGVVVGILGLAGILGGVFFFLRYRRRQEAEEEYKRAAAINEFVGKAPPTSHSSLTDSRLDPEVMFRRQSDGSIADNQDYSRRILQVRNPDGF